MTTSNYIGRLLAAAGLCVVLAGCGSEAPEEASAPVETAPVEAAPEQTAAMNESHADDPDQTLTAAGFRVSVWDGNGTGEGRLEMNKDGEAVYMVTGERFELGGPGPSSGRVGLGEDITGDGIPNLVVELWTGGTVCCVDYLVYELQGEEPELLGRVSAQTGGRFEDYDNDGSYEVRIHDGTFLGWNASVADSPAPPVVLRWDGLWYTPDAELMRAPAPTPVQLAEWTALVENGEEWDRAGEFAPPAQLWGVALDLIYTGHPDLAMAFMESAWRADVEGRDAFIASFLSKLSESEHYRAIQRGG